MYPPAEKPSTPDDDLMDAPTRQAIREFCRMARNMLVPAARHQLAATGMVSEERATRLAFAWLTQIVIDDPALPQANPYASETCDSSHIVGAGSYPPLPSGTVEALSRNLQETQVLKMVRANPQILGWLYQHFHASELIPYRGVRAPKVPADKVPIKTQLFTPGWIVEVLLQNTLGCLWLQMHPDSHLRQSLAYLVPLPESASAAMRPVREIRLLDPACGTMHFGLVAFDLFRAMYREELERAGEPGWPDHPSVTNEEEIPASILRHNLFGIDIDPFAIEVSVRALWLKARSIAPNESFPPANLACANVLQRDPLLSNEHIAHSYDILVTNPPYLDRRDYEPEMKRILEICCPAGKRNLYAAFLLRCLELLAPGGRLGIITPQTFMFLPSFAELRQSLCCHAAIEMLVHTGLGTFVDAVVDCAFYVLRREEDAERRKESAGVYFQLLQPRTAEGKQESFTKAITALQRGEQPAEVWRTRQSDFDALPGAPWVYWMTPGIRRLFAELPTLSSLAPPRQGLATTDNRRFVRYWWEVGIDRIAFGCCNATEAKNSGKRWFPYMKGGSFRRWWGNQKWVVNWLNDGAEIKAQIVGKYPYLKGNWQWVAKNSAYYFRPGVTYSYLTSGRFSARYSPGGFLFDVAGSSLFPEDWRLVLAVLNSRFAAYALHIINPTVNFQAGDLGRLPMPCAISDRLGTLVEEAIALSRLEDAEDETCFAFVAPPNWVTGLEELATRHKRIAEVETKIDEEVYRLYGLSAKDRARIEAEGAQPHGQCGPDRRELALRWISYAVGVVLGRFQPGVAGALGTGRFGPDVTEQLRILAATEEFVPLGTGSPHDLDCRVIAALRVMLGPEHTAELVREAVGDAMGLRNYLSRDYFRRHVRQYCKRPVYWLLQSPRTRVCFYVFSERITTETLPRILQDYIIPLSQHTGEADIQEFARRLQSTIARGYTPYPDDGILLNLAPLWELLPAWFTEPRKTWKALQQGEYGWSMRSKELASQR